ncbi:hypothetical protein KP509_02G112000 [Ceratopteris richardii]|nr:hypothetical protein KP509_02G112000 [Ceratopteris richardii]
MYDSKNAEIEMSIMNLHRTIQIERERTSQLENELRILHLSEMYLKERVQRLEERDLHHRRSLSAGSVPIEHLMERTMNIQSKQENAGDFLQDLLKMLQVERDKVSSLMTEVKILRATESHLVDRVRNLEEKFNDFLSKSRQSENFINDYEKRKHNEF